MRNAAIQSGTRYEKADVKAQCDGNNEREQKGKEKTTTVIKFRQQHPTEVSFQVVSSNIACIFSSHFSSQVEA